MYKIMNRTILLTFTQLPSHMVWLVDENISPPPFPSSVPGWAREAPLEGGQLLQIRGDERLGMQKARCMPRNSHGMVWKVERRWYRRSPHGQIWQDLQAVARAREKGSDKYFERCQGMWLRHRLLDFAPTDGLHQKGNWYFIQRSLSLAYARTFWVLLSEAKEESSRTRWESHCDMVEDRLASG